MPDGHLDYRDQRRGRRIFATDSPQIPLGAPPQSGLFDLNDHAGRYQDQLVNLLRVQVGAWRQSGCTGVTCRVTRDLLAFWFDDPQRPDWQRPFFFRAARSR